MDSLSIYFALKEILVVKTFDFGRIIHLRRSNR